VAAAGMSSDASAECSFSAELQTLLGETCAAALKSDVHVMSEGRGIFRWTRSSYRCIKRV